MIFQTKAKLIKNIAVAQNYYKIILACPQIAKEANPGQFLNIRVSEGCVPLLRRPFSIHRVRNSEIEILFEVVGKGTEVLSQRKEGESLDIIGPLGNGFDYTLCVKRHALPILIAGGMGIAPLLFLADRLAYDVERTAYRKDKKAKLSAKRYPLNAKVLIGAKTKAGLLCEKEVKELGCEVEIATDDGSKGFKGKVTDLLTPYLSAKYYPLSVIYACGPYPMLKEIANISKKYNISAQISLEEHMACGIGVCLGCAVRTNQGYKRVCKEGPVFSANQIIWGKGQNG